MWISYTLAVTCLISRAGVFCARVPSIVAEASHKCKSCVAACSICFNILLDQCSIDIDNYIGTLGEQDLAVVPVGMTTQRGFKRRLDEDKKRYPHPVVFDPESYGNLREIGALSKRKRVALLCVEDELAICHCKVLLDIMLRDRMVDSAVAIEPESLVPGAGWANVRCDCAQDWKAELDARKAARRK